MSVHYQAFYESPIGNLLLTSTAEALVSVLFTDEAPQPDPAVLPSCLALCRTQLTEYFAGERQEFQLPLAPAGTAFQEQVWQQLEQICFGHTLSYNDLSRQLGNPAAIRAVGSANGRNPLLLIRPCHRVIGADGKLVGYAGGLWRKKWLLAHERTVKGDAQLNLF